MEFWKNYNNFINGHFDIIGVYNNSLNYHLQKKGEVHVLIGVYPGSSIIHHCHNPVMISRSSLDEVLSITLLVIKYGKFIICPVNQLIYALLLAVSIISIPRTRKVSGQ